jgi:hypothetical protein
MLSMNGIIVCELILSTVLIGLIFTSFSDTDLIADPSSKSNNATQSDQLKTSTKPGLARIELSPDGLLSKSDGGGSGSSGK